MIVGYVKKLLDADLIEEVDGGYTTPEDVEKRVSEEVRITGCAAKARRQKEKFNQERRIRKVHRLAAAGLDFDGIAFRTGLSVAKIMEILEIPEHAPTEEEMRQYRAERNPDGLLDEIEREASMWETFVSEDEAQRPLELTKI